MQRQTCEGAMKWVGKEGSMIICFWVPMGWAESWDVTWTFETWKPTAWAVFPCNARCKEGAEMSTKWEIHALEWITLLGAVGAKGGWLGTIYCMESDSDGKDRLWRGKGTEELVWGDTRETVKGNPGSMFQMKAMKFCGGNCWQWFVRWEMMDNVVLEMLEWWCWWGGWVVRGGSRIW